MSVAAVALTAAALGQPSGGPPPANVVLDAARMEMVEQVREVTGHLRALKRSLLATEESGLVIAIGLQAGDPVRQGQVIARLDDTLAALAVQREAAQVEHKRGVHLERVAELELAQRDLARYEDAKSSNAVAAMELDARRTQVAAWEARVRQAKAEVEVAEALLAEAQRRHRNMTVFAPFDGRVVAKQTEVGQWLREGDPVAEILQLDVVEARLDVPEGLIAALVEGESKARVRLSASGKEFSATVARVVPVADPLSRLFPVRLEIENPREELRPGMSITGLVPLKSRAPALTVHKDALLRDDAGEFAYFSENGVAAVARVRRFFAAGDRVVIEPGRVREGTLMVVEGNERMFPGQPLVSVGGAARN